MIAILPREDYARLNANLFREKMNITTVPIDLHYIFQANNWFFSWSDLVSGTGEAITYHYKGFYGTYFPEKCKTFALCRLRWSLAHEAGHIVLNHFGDFNLSIICSDAVGCSTIAVLDREADIFCEEFLMPREFIEKHKHLGANYLQGAFGVSKQAMEIRLKALGLTGLTA